MKFKNFKDAVHDQFSLMSGAKLFVTDTTKDKMWETYIDSFPEGANPIFRERTEHDCQCCKQFIRACGNVVSIIDNKLVSIWDIQIGGYYQDVADAMATLVKSAKVRDVFLHGGRKLGTDFNRQEVEGGDPVKWTHFYFELPSGFVMNVESIGTELSKLRSNKEVSFRGLSEISCDAVKTVIELIEQNSIYRGEEHKNAVELFNVTQGKFADVPGNEKDNFCWALPNNSARIRNTVIGSLLIDISDGKSLDEAVKMFESKVAPTNYKRPTAMITKSMINNAQKKVVELGIEPALGRRFSVLDDITINNVIFADRMAKKEMSVFDTMKAETPSSVKNLDKVDEVTIGDFLKDIVPKAESIELLLENRHTNNLVSLISPLISENVPQIFKWGNNFSWAYHGEVADSMRQRVKAAGGKIDGVLRFSIQWNDGDNNQNDFDAHCQQPNGRTIYYSAMQDRNTSGRLDVDITNPGGKVAVENIVYSDLGSMPEGKYKMLVHNYSHNGGKTGFTAEIEFDNQIFSYEYAKELRNGQKVVVAEVEYSKQEGFKILESLPSTKASKEIWGINTENFHRVAVIMNSPNHWDGEETGNKHFFFMLDGCKNDLPVRGFFNEFLKEDLTEHRKVFEVLGSKMKAEVSDDQLSGLGFSSTQRNHVFCKVVGSFTRIIKINL